MKQPISNKKFLFSKKDILSGVAKWGIAQSPYHRPEGLEIVLDKLDKRIAPLFPKTNYGFGNLPYEKLIDFVFKHTTAIPEFRKWNKPKKSAGKDFIASSLHYHTTKPDYDYIDLHALARNVAQDIIRNSEGATKSIQEILGRGKLTVVKKS